MALAQHTSNGITSERYREGINFAAIDRLQAALNQIGA